MGWADCGEDDLGRPIGYSYEATCDHPDCGAEIDRGLGYACGGRHGEEGIAGQPGCPRYYCGDHLDPEDHGCDQLKEWRDYYEQEESMTNHINEALGLMSSMIESGERHSDVSKETLTKAREQIKALEVELEFMAERVDHVEEERDALKTELEAWKQKLADLPASPCYGCSMDQTVMSCAICGANKTP